MFLNKQVFNGHAKKSINITGLIKKIKKILLFNKNSFIYKC